ncbi:helix-turn-helix transcriptional regulator [Micromonospora sp. NPDC049559]|uniref:helix-turn-helix domain-containing protein n=1 Tax=Micromonospora sp. NPDC049559 TaxID=3155923 RepID=UPI003413C982
MTPYEFFLRELRRRREGARLTQEELGKRINFSGSHVSAVELGNRPPKDDFLEAVDLAFDTGELFRRMWKDLIEDAAPAWLREWIEIERRATLLRWFEPTFLPGLLQTEAYARAVLSGGVLADPDVINQRLASRMERQSILTREQPPTFVAVIDEGVLRRPLAPPAVMVEQFEHLGKIGQLPHVRLHVVPAEVGMHAGLAGGFILAKGPEGQAAHLDSALRAYITVRADDIDSLQTRWEKLRSDALPRRATLDLIREVAKTWT